MNTSIILISLLLVICLIVLYCLHNQKEEYSILNILAFNRIKDVLFGSLLKPAENKMPIPISSFLQKYGNYKVIRLELCRQPVVAAIKEVMNALSFGRLKGELKVRGIDDILHLWCNVEITNGEEVKRFSIEKNETVQIKEYRKGTECFEVIGPSMWNVSLHELISNAEKVHTYGGFWLYNPASNNCQYFVLSLLNGSGYLTPDAYEFLNQNAERILEKSGFAVDVASKVVNFAANLRNKFRI